MDCIRNCLRISVSGLLISGVVYLGWANYAEGAFAIKSSPTVGELYTDNLFYTKNKEADFVTILTPTLSLLYAPEGQTAPVANFDIWSSGLIFARHGELNNFGNNWGLNGNYNYEYSPRLNFYVSDVLGRQGEYRLGPLTPTELPGYPVRIFFAPPTAPPLAERPPQSNQELSSLTTGGFSALENNFNLGGKYLFRSDIMFRGNYNNFFVNYSGQQGQYLQQTIRFQGIYNWRKEHNLHAGVSVDIYNNRNSSNVNNQNNVVVSFDVGDDYFSNFQINLSPTLTLTASTGISLNAGNNGPPVANNTYITLTKIWETAVLSAGVHHGLGSSYGVGGVSNTTTTGGQFLYQVTEKLSTLARVNFGLYDTDGGNFQGFQASAGARYQFTPWLASDLLYAYRWTSSSTAAATSDLLQAGVVRANTVYLALTANFDLWPNVGLSRSISFPGLTPLVTTPFPQATTPTTTPPP
jgi:hypothetical protein